MKIGNLYNLPSFQGFLDCGKKAGFADSDAGVILARHLTAIDPKVFEKKYPELTFLNSGIQADNSGGFARRIQSLRTIEKGAFADSNDSSDNKGKISLTAEDSFIKVFPKQAHSIWSDDEVKEAAMGNINLPQKYLVAHNTIYSQLVDTIGYVGTNGQVGLLNAGFGSTGATAPIASATAVEMYDDLAGLITDQWNGVYNTPEYMANKVTMPTDVYNKISKAILNTAAGSSTVLKALKDNFPGVDFVSTAKADDVDGSGSVTCAYSNNAEAMKMRIPLPLTIGEIIKINSFDHRVDSKFRIAGLDILEATAGRYVTGL
jgi:hypothetical protein